MILYEKPFVTMSSDVFGIDIIWRGHMPDAGFQEAVDFLVAYTKRAKPQKILTDTTQSGPISRAMQIYLETAFALLHEAGMTHIASVMPERVTTQIGMEIATATMRKAGLITQEFANRAEARTWLLGS